MGSYRPLATGTRLLGQGVAEQRLRANMAQEEETAQIAEGSAEELLHNAQQAELGEQQEELGLVDKAKDKLMGH